MKITTNDNNEVVLEEVYNGVLLRTKEGNAIGACMRDDTIEINVIPRGSLKRNWFRVNMQTGDIERMDTRTCDDKEPKSKDFNTSGAETGRIKG